MSMDFANTTLKFFYIKHSVKTFSCTLKSPILEHKINFNFEQCLNSNLLNGVIYVASQQVLFKKLRIEEINQCFYFYIQFNIIFVRKKMDVKSK